MNKIKNGEVYLFDVLNETNIAPLVNTVTIVKKCRRRGYYTVVSNENHSVVFDVHKKYLTKYNKNIKNVVIRSKGGTIDFDEIDAFCISSIVDIVKDVAALDESNVVTNLLMRMNTIKEKINSYAKANKRMKMIELRLGVEQRINKFLSKFYEEVRDNERVNTLQETLDKANEVIAKYFPVESIICDRMITDGDIENMYNHIYSEYENSKDGVIMVYIMNNKLCTSHINDDNIGCLYEMIMNIIEIQSKKNSDGKYHIKNTISYIVL